jgi:hypothetical protein
MMEDDLAGLGADDHSLSPSLRGAKRRGNPGPLAEHRGKWLWIASLLSQ